jgi:hypothetical protein
VPGSSEAPGSPGSPGISTRLARISPSCHDEKYVWWLVVTTVASGEPTRHRYRSGPVEPSAGCAEKASQRPSSEYATSPTTLTPVAIAMASSGVGPGVAVGGPVAAAGDAVAVAGGSVTNTVGVGVASGPLTGTTRTLPGSPALGSEANTSWSSLSSTCDGASPTSIDCAAPSGFGTHFRLDRWQSSLTSRYTSSHEPLAVSLKIATGSASGTRRPVGSGDGANAKSEAPAVAEGGIWGLDDV